MNCQRLRWKKKSQTLHHSNSIHMILYGNEVRCLVLDLCVSHSANSIVKRYFEVYLYSNLQKFAWHFSKVLHPVPPSQRKRLAAFYNRENLIYNRKNNNLGCPQGSWTLYSDEYSYVLSRSIFIYTGYFEVILMVTGIRFQTSHAPTCCNVSSYIK